MSRSSSSAEELRAVMRAYPSGVTLVTTILDGIPHGFTANAFCSVSLSPPTVLVCVNQRARSHALITKSRIFCVNILRFEQQELAERFAVSSADDQFSNITWRSIAGGAPHIVQSLASIDCRLAEEYPVTTHSIFVGRVCSTLINKGHPLGYLDGSFRDFGASVVSTK